MATDIGLGLKIVGAGIAIGFAALGSGIGQGTAAAAGIGAVSEKEEMMGKSLAFATLVETQAIYGFVIAILILFVI
ncbi:MAG: V-type ATP synthase subunit K [Candidatus Hydrothermarchaeales archaeon]